MRSTLKKIAIFLFVILVVIQLFDIEKNEFSAEDYDGKDISEIYPLSDEVQQVLQNSCYDCHSNQTQYPWYASLQPVGWWLQHHVNEGKHELNFSEFAGYRLRRQYHKFEEIIEQVKENEMPLSSYTLIHRNAKLNDLQKSTLTNWAKAMLDTMRLKYPYDSLHKK
jgi:hypothetical protein